MDDILAFIIHAIYSLTRVGRIGGGQIVLSYGNNPARTGLSCLYIFGVLSLFAANAALGQPANYEGFGTVTRGAADSPAGYSTYHVTSLANSGRGTFRDAVSRGSRLVVFDVAGTINLSGSLHIRSSYITIDGASAPSPGITISLRRGSDLYILGRAHDIIINNIRVDGNYTGPATGKGDVFGLDGYYGSGPVYNVIIDHCTFTSAGDGVQDTRGTIRNVTYSWNLFKDADFMGSFSDPGVRENISLHHNVYARGGERIPKIKNEDGSTTTQFDMVNNVVYGWNTYGVGFRGLQIEPFGWLLQLHVTGNWYEPLDGADDNAITIAGTGHQMDFEGNVFPAGELDDIDTAVLPPPIPAWARVTTYDANTLGDTVVPFVGTRYRTAEEQFLLNEISAAIGGGQRPGLSLSSRGGGSVTDPGEGSFLYDDGIVVPIEATAENNCHFVSWTGTAVDAGKVADPNAAGTEVKVDAHYTIQANFGASDGTAPVVTGRLPDVEDFQVPLNSFMTLHVTDALGVDAGSVEIKVDGDIVYTGDTSQYNSATGVCRRVGTPTDFTYAYQPSRPFDFDQFVTVTVNAADLGGVAMDEQSYSFRTEMRSFGQNKRVSSDSGTRNSGRPAAVRDADGNIWAVWHAGPIGGRSIYIAKLAPGADAFGACVRISSNSADQANPAVAIGTDNRLYVVWQDDRQGDWDIYGSTSTGGAIWSAERRLVDSNDNYDQTRPALAIDSQSPNRAHVVWQEGAAGDRNIYIATSSNDFVTNTVTQITSDGSEQTEPAVAVDSQDVVYLVWTDARTAADGSDIYGAASDDGLWMNRAMVTKPGNQSSPAIAAESSGSNLHMLWVDETLADIGIYYGCSDALAGPLSGTNIIDEDNKGKGQTSPAIAVFGTGSDLDVFASWRDGRHADADIFFVQANPVAGTNVFVGDGGTNSNQSEPAIGTDLHGYPYLVWTDDRDAGTEIYFAASAHMQSTPLAFRLVTAAASTQTVGTDPADIDDIGDVSVVLPAHALPYDVTVTVTPIENPPEYVLPVLNGFAFGPSGMVFNSPVTMTIPYAVTDAAGTPAAYWYDSRTGMLSQEGITDPEIIVLSPTLHALSFKALHFTPYYVLLVPDVVDIGSGIEIDNGGGGGGCTLSHSRQGNALAYFLPYGALALFMFVLKGRDRRSGRLREKRL
ncbi:MAG: InlB B-repeat-containing protein [Planctomycetota bacterium]